MDNTRDLTQVLLEHAFSLVNHSSIGPEHSCRCGFRPRHWLEWAEHVSRIVGLRMIATVAELDALEEDSVILDDGWYPKIKGRNNKWWRPDCRRGISAEGTVLPTRLLWTPEYD